MEQHIINVDNKGDDADDRVIRRANNIQQKITQGIKSLHPLPKEPCIFKVHQRLRQVNKMAYTPMLVSIGPYHHGKPEFDAMEEHKKRYLDLLLKRTNLSMESLLEAMIKLEDKARYCYANPFDLGENSSFVEMMLLDGCFVIEFLRKAASKQLQVGDDPIFKESWMATQICSDLMLLENQLPFFVLSELNNMSMVPTIPSFQLTPLVVFPISYMLPAAIYYRDAFSNCNSCKHFLDLVHKVCVPSLHTPPVQNIPKKICMGMPCLMELREAGISVKVTAEEDCTKVNMFDFKFEWEFKIFRWRRMLKIPKFTVTDATEVFFRNIIAYEQHSSDEDPKYFTDYTYFMDLLINTKEDVKQLCRSNIIENMLGDEEEVASMFNKMGNGRIIHPSFYYSKLCKGVNAHCDRFWNKAIAKLRRDYFNNPWASVSTVAAALLLGLTLIQTLAALK